MQTRWISILRHWPAALIFALALVIGWLATRDGVNYFMDSTWYLVYARNVQAGNGLSAAITSNLDPQTTTWINQWPPLYPLFLALADPMTWGHVSTLLLSGITLVLTYALTLVLIPGARAAAFCAALLLLTFPALSSQVFASIYSETLFVPLCLGATLLLMRYRFGQPAPLHYALGAALLIALASLTRYVGVAFAVMAGVYLLLWGRTVQQPRRWLPALLMLVALLPVAGYMLYLYNLTGSPTGVQTAADQTAFGDIPQSLQVILLEILHGFRFALRQVGLRSNYAVLVVGLVLAALGAIFTRRQWAGLRQQIDSRYLLLALYLACYMGLFWVLAVRSRRICASGPPRAARSRHLATVILRW